MIETAGIILFNKNKRVLILKPSGSENELWTIPKGHVEQGEKLIEAAVRETQEETGIDLSEFLEKKKLLYLGETTYNNEKKKIHVFYLRIKKLDDFEPKLNWEHSEYKWIKPSEAKDLVHKAQIEYFLLLEDFFENV